MKKYKVHIAYIIILVATILCFTKCDNNDADYINKLEQAKQSAQDSIKVLTINNQFINAEIDRLKDSINSLTLKNKKLKQELVSLKKEEDEKINAVDNYTIDELQRFFTNRYGK